MTRRSYGLWSVQEISARWKKRFVVYFHDFSVCYLITHIQKFHGIFVTFDAFPYSLPTIYFIHASPAQIPNTIHWKISLKVLNLIIDISTRISASLSGKMHPKTADSKSSFVAFCICIYFTTLPPPRTAHCILNVNDDKGVNLSPLDIKDIHYSMHWVQVLHFIAIIRVEYLFTINNAKHKQFFNFHSLVKQHNIRCWDEDKAKRTSDYVYGSLKICMA